MLRPSAKACTMVSPYGLGYFCLVAFSLGIICRTSGLSVFQGFLTSLLNNTSAGEFAAITLIGQNASYTEIALVTLIANARYMLMSCALSQRLSSAQGFIHRLAMAFAVTDELFGIAISRPGVLNPYYYYGGMAVAIPGWSIGTVLRHYRRCCAARAYCQRTECSTVWHVPCYHHAPCTRKPYHFNCCNHKLHRQLRSNIHGAVGAAYRRYTYHYPHCSHRSGCSLVQAGYSPANGGS